MRWIALVALLLSGCMTPRDDGRLEKRVDSLEREILVLREDNLRMRERLIELEAAREAAAPASPASSPGARLAARCAKSESGYTLTRKEVDEIFENTTGLATEMRIVPAFENGHARGFKLFAIRADSFVASCGFQNGDVLTHVNGREINSPDKALEAYSQTKNADRVEFALERKGAKTYVVITPRS